MNIKQHTEQEQQLLLELQTWSLSRDLERLSHYFDGMPGPLSVAVMHARRFDFAYVNESFRQFYGVAEEEDLVSFGRERFLSFVEPSSLAHYLRVQRWRDWKKELNPYQLLVKLRSVWTKEYQLRLASHQPSQDGNWVFSLSVPVNETGIWSQRLKRQLRISSLQLRYYEHYRRLSARELEVLAHWGQGKSMQQTASLLSCSSETVKQHLSNLRAKLPFSSFHEYMRFIQAFEIYPKITG